MTRDQQLRAALVILKPTIYDREQCRRDILQIIDIIDAETEMEKNSAVFGSKPAKTKVQSLRNTLDRVRVIHGALPDPVRHTVFKDLDLKQYINACDAIINQPSKGKSPAVRQRLATAGAQSLLFDYRIKPVVTRRGDWDRLAAILFGDRKAAMFNYIREFKAID